MVTLHTASGIEYETVVCKCQGEGAQWEGGDHFGNGALLTRCRPCDGHGHLIHCPQCESDLSPEAFDFETGECYDCGDRRSTGLRARLQNEALIEEMEDSRRKGEV